MNDKQDQEREALERDWQLSVSVAWQVRGGNSIARAGTIIAINDELQRLRAALAQQAEPVGRIKDGLYGEYVKPELIGHWWDGPETFVIVRAKDAKLGSQTYGLEAEPQSVMFNGLTEAETMATASVAGLTEPQRAGLSEEQLSKSVALAKDLRSFESDHTPDGWPAIRMSQISELCEAVESMAAALRGIGGKVE